MVSGEVLGTEREMTHRTGAPDRRTDRITVVERSESRRKKGRDARNLKVFVIFASLASGAVVGCHLPVRISSYQGDGNISRIHFFLNPGFQVDFEQFSLASPYSASYRLEGLPKHWDTYVVNLVPDLPASELGRRPKMLEAGPVGTLTLRVVDGNGRRIFDCSSPLDKMGWIWLRGEAVGIIMARLAPEIETSTFLINRSEPPEKLPKILEVNYEPQGDAPEIMARIRITAGGTE